jgi:hypothetical protein
MSNSKVLNLEKAKNSTPSSHYGALSQIDEITLRTTKEIVIKFIEMGRCSPATFEEVFTQVFKVIKRTVLNSVK